jgi:Ulp1 family protease
VYIPVNVGGNHWILYIVDVASKKYSLLDSNNSNKEEIRQEHKFGTLQEWLKEPSYNKYLELHTDEAAINATNAVAKAQRDLKVLNKQQTANKNSLAATDAAALAKDAVNVINHRKKLTGLIKKKERAIKKAVESLSEKREHTELHLTVRNKTPQQKKDNCGVFVFMFIFYHIFNKQKIPENVIQQKVNLFRDKMIIYLDPQHLV